MSRTATDTAGAARAPAVAVLILPYTSATDPEAAIRFYRCAGEQPVEVFCGTPEALAGRADFSPADPIVCVVTAEALLHLWVPAPLLRPRHRTRAITYLVEEHLATAVEQVHVAIGPRDAGGRTPVIALEAAWLDGWLARVLALGIRPDEVYAETQLIDADDGSALRILCAGSRWLFALPGAAAGAVASDNAAVVLSRLLAGSTCRRVVLYGGDAEARAVVDLLPPGAAHDRIVEHLAAPADVRAALVARVLDATPGFGLLQGRFAGAGRRARLKQLLRVATVATVVLATLIGFDLVRGLQHARQAARLNAQAHTLYRELFPHDTRIVHLQRQFAAQLAALDRPPAPLFTQRLRQALAPLVDPPITDDSGVQSIEYHAGTDTLRLQIRFDDVQHAERYRSAFTDPAWPARLVSTDAVDDGILARIDLGTGHAQ
ncbi:MAG: hypothetical protein CALGDGBN_02798 [Pseudomonadales bacterium]|nr:hypothetical protein [Pseudomonadales bacterium]